LDHYLRTSVKSSDIPITVMIEKFIKILNTQLVGELFIAVVIGVILAVIIIKLIEEYVLIPREIAKWNAEYNERHERIERSRPATVSGPSGSGAAED